VDVQEGQTSNPHDWDGRSATDSIADRHIGTTSSLPEESDTATSNGNYEADLEQHHAMQEENAPCKSGVQVVEDSVVQEVAAAGKNSPSFLPEAAPSSLPAAADTAPSSGNHQEEGARSEDVMQAAENPVVQEVASAGNSSRLSTSFAKKAFGSISGTLRIGKKTF